MRDCACARQPVRSKTLHRGAQLHDAELRERVRLIADITEKNRFGGEGRIQ